MTLTPVVRKPFEKTLSRSITLKDCKMHCTDPLLPDLGAFQNERTAYTIGLHLKTT
jgi:hypothetical protein